MPPSHDLMWASGDSHIDISNGLYLRPRWAEGQHDKAQETCMLMHERA